ncbi:iron ABC transporter permease [Hymenobacter sp. BT559]|uniref:FecCD family ABC transporter permease n=1 Tax=Hymenobacter sp. BT559 TaxID=2795729 RepID=UPI0018ED57A8|nr:iron ABC transporter permease [Hymenobacter sp. BT559]MBJ6142331.1 iron ABC transporter permease [Hymenobacter sp. BT559]
MPVLAPPIPTTQTPAARPAREQRVRLLLVALAGLLVLAALLGAGAGALRVPVSAVVGILLHKLNLATSLAFEPQQEAVIWAIRLPRVLLAVLVGAALGLAGAAMQGLFRNPLADPSLLGISAGASLAAVAVIVLEEKLLKTVSVVGGLGSYLLPVAAFAGACLTTLFVYRVARRGGRVLVSTMLLVGVATNGLAEAITGLFTYAATDAQLRSITFWGLGSLGGASWDTLSTLAPLLALPLLWLPRLGKPLNLLALGEEQATHLGLPVARLKWQIIGLTTLAVGASVAMVGTIGFLGFLVPHVLRRLAGPDHRFILPASALGGALVLLLADTLARTAVAPAELPIGILTALLGAPVFLWIVMRESRRLG